MKCKNCYNDIEFCNYCTDFLSNIFYCGINKHFCSNDCIIYYYNLTEVIDGSDEE